MQAIVSRVKIDITMDKQDYLAQLPIFQNLSADELRELARLSYYYQIPPGKIVARPGEMASGLYIIYSGHLIITRDDGHGSAHDYHLQDNAYFQDKWLIAPEPHSGTVRSLTETHLLLIRQQDFAEFIEHKPFALSKMKPVLSAQGFQLAGLSTEAWEIIQQLGVLSLPELHAYLGNLPLFKGLDHPHLEDLSSIAVETAFPAGVVVARQHDLTDNLYILRTGELRTIHVSEDDIVDDDVYPAGSYFDEDWLFTTGSHPHTLRTTQFSHIITIRKAEFHRFLEEHDGVFELLQPQYDELGNHIAGLHSHGWQVARENERVLLGDAQNFLAQIDTFKNLSDKELADLAKISEEYAFESGAVIAYQRDIVNQIYMLRSGRFFAKSIDRRGVVRDSRSYFAGDAFNDEWLFESATHTSMVKAASPGRVVIINGPDFLKFLASHPSALAKLKPVYKDGNHVAGLTEAGWSLASKTRSNVASTACKSIDLVPDELLEYCSRRSQWRIILGLGVPGVIWLIIVVLLLLLLTNPILLGTLLILISLGFMAYMTYQWLEWSNDYFIVTNRHVMHYEFNLNLSEFGAKVNKTPIDQVQSAAVLKPTFLQNLFRVGTTRITTAAQDTVILFDFIDDPDAANNAINAVLNRRKKQASDLRISREQAEMRELIEDHFDVAPPLNHIEKEQKEEVVKIYKKPGRFQTRIVTPQGDIIYRKHIFVLLGEAGLPGVVLLTLLILLAAVGFLNPNPILLTVLIITTLPIAGWFIWRVEDWRNDTFTIADRVVTDIDRAPLGFSVSRKQADIENIQNVRVDQVGILASIFRFGDVHIDTAGAQSDITFESVGNPQQIQNDIFSRRAKIRREKDKRDRLQRQHEYAVLLDVYKQAIEQDRIPQRTPASESN